MTLNNTDIKELSSLNAQFIKNFTTQDTMAHNQIIHRDFVCIESSGAIVDRDEYLREWAISYQTSGYTSFEYTDEFIRIFGNMALVRSRTAYTVLKEGVTIRGGSVYTDTYVKENGKWLCVQAQITGIKPQ
ncbi:MAG: nuclear transport factor 2 family protein [Cyclobacteriaceae bacterium]